VVVLSNWEVAKNAAARTSWHILDLRVALDRQEQRSEDFRPGSQWPGSYGARPRAEPVKGNLIPLYIYNIPITYIRYRTQTNTFLFKLTTSDARGPLPLYSDLALWAIVLAQA
jgi:hypothetical protein